MSASRTCYACNQPGHILANCPNKTKYAPKANTTPVESDQNSLTNNIIALVKSPKKLTPVAEGFSASVSSVTIDSKDYVLKVVEWPNSPQTSRLEQEFRRETKVYQAIFASDSPLKEFVCSYYGSHQENNRAGMLLEKANTDAFNILKCQSSPQPSTSTKFTNPSYLDSYTGEHPSPFWLQICLDIAKGLQCLHNLGFYHRDLHMMNWLYFLGDTQTRPKAKLCDFGGTLRENEEPISFSGHIRFSSPSVCKQRKEKKPIKYGFADDIFMYGMSLYEIVQGYQGESRVWPNLGNWQVADKIIAGERPPITRKVSKKFQSLIEDCWHQDTTKRPEISEVVTRLTEMLKEVKTEIREVKSRSAANIHTCHLYLTDEVMSILQKAVRRGNAYDAMYWAAELDASGMGKGALDRLTVVASEDVSLTVPSMPSYINSLYKEYFAKQKSKTVLLRMAEAIASVYKCRSANNACGYSLALVQQRIEANQNVVQVPTLQQLKTAMDQARTDFSMESEALYLLQRMFMEVNAKGVHIHEERIWKMVASLETTRSETSAAIGALHDLTIPRHIGGESGSRLRLFHAVLLYTREPWLNYDATIPESNQSMIEEVIKKVSMPGLEGRHAEGVPIYAVDRHNRRGKGGVSDTYYLHGDDTSNFISIGAAEWKLDISNWPKSEVMKSHGPGRRFFKNRYIGKPTALSQFFEEGSDVNLEYLPPVKLENGKAVCPYRPIAAEFYQIWEAFYGSLNAKSVHISSKQNEMIRKLREESGLKEEVKVEEPEELKAPAPQKKTKNRVQGSWAPKQ